ncbi:histone deacetylase 6 isoform X2 [Phlebotomus argentipes]|uniref:histone deacetylase 6 isoform X2 n=1 Tax=Phlebotomus argentipes TaxID=94469 RepID=UPI00289372EE|nr:histone deacetylase 6 isoform X2 [Phlebotomus argentipes]
MSSPAVTRRAAQKAKIQTRAMASGRRPQSSALLEAKKRARQKISSGEKRSSDVQTLRDPYQTAMEATKMIRGATGLVYDRQMAQHLCLWDENYPECPARLTRVLDRCQELKLLDRCQTIEPKVATKEQILLKHTDEHFETLKRTSGVRDEQSLEDLSSRFDAIYIHPTTFELSLLSVGSTVALVDAVAQGRVQNGMAIIRPPGHHAMKAEFNGYCFFNNVAIAAAEVLASGAAERVLIVDWDIHHGQGTQRMFYDDPRVLYFSVHRFEHGQFWPNLRESDFDCVGAGAGRGFNVNLPLNQTGMTDADYLAIFQQILLPMAIEFAPNLVIVSAGFDSALGDEKGEMEITPAGYAHLLSPLMSLAAGKVAVILEGGYCLRSLAEGAALTLKTLLGDPCPNLQPLTAPCESVQESILNCISVHRPFWRCFQVHRTYGLEEVNNINPPRELHQVVSVFKGSTERPERFETRNCYPVQSEESLRKIDERLQRLEMSTRLTVAPKRVCLAYDNAMTQHRNDFEEHPECPERITKIWERFQEFGTADRMHRVTTRRATEEDLCLVHAPEHVKLMQEAVQRRDLEAFGDRYNSVYFHSSTWECATVAAGCVLQTVDEVLNGNCQSGICVVRPPGHHAESDLPHGFCIFNNVAVAAEYAVRNHGLRRVLIVDWDVHHGNGIQHIFETRRDVLYISLHRFDHGNFFPKSPDGDYSEVGSGAGEGFNVNIPWNRKGMGDVEYTAAFHSIVMPIAYEFNPELVLVSAGFDAAVGDPLGGCKVSPEAYGHFTHWLSALANGRLIICLEGGYNVNSISYAMTMCSKALLGDPLPPLDCCGRDLSASCVETLRSVMSVQRKYWRCLKFCKKLPDFVAGDDAAAAGGLSEMMQGMAIADEPCDSDSTNERTKKKAGDPQPGPSTSRGQTTSGEANQSLSDYLAENAAALANEEMFAVVPLKNCPHLAELEDSRMPKEINTRGPCEECASPDENWICLHCFRTLCGRYVGEHMLFHHLDAGHPLTLSFSDLSVWCYKCESYIDNPMLYKYKNMAHVHKFGGEEMVWPYGSDTLRLDQVANN